MVKLSIITATYNSESTIKDLIKSLKAQDDNEFEWVVADGGSSDKTINILESEKERGDISICIVYGPDFGIYDGLNKAIKASSGSHYIVVGSDDAMDARAVSNFKGKIENGFDIITASCEHRGFLNKFLDKYDVFSPMRKYVYGHSVYTCFKKNLHEKNGFYSRKYPIAADLLFIRKCVFNGASVEKCEFTPGFFSNSGVSNTDTLGVLTETMRVQCETGVKSYLAISVFLLRLIKSFFKR